MEKLKKKNKTHTSKQFPCTQHTSDILLSGTAEDPTPLLTTDTKENYKMTRQ